MLIFSTTPECSVVSIKSPTLKGLSTRMITPPAKFAKLPFKARLRATHADATIVVSPVKFTPMY